MTNEQLNSKLRGKSYKGETKDLYPLIREKREIEIEITQPYRAGPLSLTESNEKENAKPFLITHSTIMSSFIIILQEELCAHYVMIKT